MSTEGRRVVYAGVDLTIGQGTLGTVLAVSADYSHVQWVDGPRVGQIDLVESYDLSVQATASSVEQVVAAQFDESLGMETSASGEIREAMDVYGEDGVIATLSEQGHLATLETYAAEAVDRLASDLRTDPALVTLLATLDDYEQETVLARLAASLLEQDQAS